MPIDYLRMIYLPERGILAPQQWDDLTMADRHLLLEMLEIEGDPAYAVKR